MEFSIATIALITIASGFLGAIVMMFGQMLERKITGREESFSPAIVFSKIFGIDFDVLTEKNKTVFNYGAHLLYGTVWAIPFVLLLLGGFTNYLSMLIIYFIIVWAQGVIIAPLLDIAPPPWKQGVKNLSKDGIHHFIYAFTTSLVFIELAQRVFSPIG